MSQLPGGVLWNPRWQAFDSNGAVIPFAELTGYETGGTFSTPKDLYSTSALTVALSSPVVADSAGRFPAMYLATGGYDLRLRMPSAGAVVWTCENVEEIGGTFLTDLGLQLTSGTLDVSSGYTVNDDDWFVSTDANDTANPFILNLGPLNTRKGPLCIKHQSAYPLRVTPQGTDPIENVAAYYQVAAAASPNLPTIWLAPEPTSYFIVSSHGL